MKGRRLNPVLLLIWLTLGVLQLGGVPSSSDPALSIAIAWDPVSHPDLAGYRIYIDVPDMGYSETQDVGLVTSHLLADLECHEHVIRLKAVKSDGTESVNFSNTVQGYPYSGGADCRGSVPLPPPQNLRIVPPGETP